MILYPFPIPPSSLPPHFQIFSLNLWFSDARLPIRVTQGVLKPLMPQAVSQDLWGWAQVSVFFFNFQNTAKVENHWSKSIIVIPPFHE